MIEIILRFLAFMIMWIPVALLYRFIWRLKNQKKDNTTNKSNIHSNEGSGYNWRCKCGSSNANTLNYCPTCKRTREDGEVKVENKS